MRLTPKTAVLEFCKQCISSAEKSDKEHCGGDHITTEDIEIVCPFFRYRLGRRRPLVKDIRKQCLWCMGGSREAVLDCETEDCPLHQYRMGHNPARNRYAEAWFSVENQEKIIRDIILRGGEKCVRNMTD